MPIIFESSKSTDSKKEKIPLLNSFIQNPNIHFESQNSDERIVLMLRAHPLTQLPWIILCFFLLLLPLFFNFFLANYLSGLQIIFVNFFWYSFVFTLIFINILNYLFNLGLVTNQRIIDIDYHGILYKEVNSTPLSKIEDVTGKTSGFINSLFNFGDIFIQTAGAHQNIEFVGVPNPPKIASIINEVMRKAT